MSKLDKLDKKLYNFCESKNLKKPVMVTEKQGAGFVSTIKIEGYTYVSSNYIHAEAAQIDAIKNIIKKICTI